LNLFEAEVKAYVCRQCDDPMCVRSCPIGAIRLDERTGVYVIVEDICVGCGLCSEACPYNGEKSILVLNQARKVFMKCDLCSGDPQCVQVCPSEALKVVR
jgi:Fe-S-cluster-containing hydrogenase component 2